MKQICNGVRHEISVTNNWKNLASKYGVGRGEIERMKVAFV